MRKIVGSIVAIRPRSIEGPTEIALCAGIRSVGETAHTLFIFGVQNIPLPPDAPIEVADPSGQYYDPQKLAERLGFKGFSWKAIHCDGRYTYFADAKHAAMSVDRIVLRLGPQIGGWLGRKGGGPARLTGTKCALLWR